MVPMGMVIPPSMKAIIGMATSPVFLASTHSPLGSVPHAYYWWDPVLSLKLFHTLLGLNSTFELSHFPKKF